MLINKLKSIILVTICCIVSASCSEVQCSESEAESKLSNPSNTLNYSNPKMITNSHDLSISHKTPPDAPKKSKLPAPVRTKEKSRPGYFPSIKIIGCVTFVAVGLGITYWLYPELVTPVLTIVSTGTATAITASNGRPSSIPTTTLNPQSFRNYNVPINLSSLNERQPPPSNIILDYTFNHINSSLKNRIARTSRIASLSEENIAASTLTDISPKILNVLSMRDFILVNTNFMEKIKTDRSTEKKLKNKEKSSSFIEESAKIDDALCEEKLTERLKKIIEDINKPKDKSKEGYCPTITNSAPAIFLFSTIKCYTDAQKINKFFKEMWNLKKEWTQQPTPKYQLIPIPDVSPQSDKSGRFYFQKFLINKNYSRLWNSVEYCKEKFNKGRKKKKEKKLLLELEHVRFENNILDSYSYPIVNIFASYKGERHSVIQNYKLPPIPHELEYVRFEDNILDSYSYPIVNIFASYKGERHLVIQDHKLPSIPHKHKIPGEDAKIFRI